MSVTRLGRDVQAVFAVAYESASDGSRTVIGKEHILVAALEAPLGAAWLSPLTAPQVRADVLPAVARARAAGGLSAADRAALGSIGIDLVFLEQRVSSLGMGEAIARPARLRGGLASAHDGLRGRDAGAGGGSRPRRRPPWHRARRTLPPHDGRRMGLRPLLPLGGARTVRRATRTGASPAHLRFFFTNA